MSTQGNGGIYSKFQQRLRNIRLSRIKKRKQNEQFVSDKVEEIRKTLDKEPYRYSHKKVFADHSKEDVSKQIDVKEIPQSQDKVIQGEDNLRNKKIGLEDRDDLEEKIVNIRENKPKYLRNKKVGTDYQFNKDNIRNISREEKVELLDSIGSIILDKIKNSFEDKLDELEVLNSELYLLNEKNNSELELKKVVELKSRIQELIVKVNAIVSQYNLYNKNYYIDNVIGIDDHVLVDDIINYRELLDSLADEKNFVHQYKVLEEFKDLYNHLRVVRDDVEKLQNANEDKICEYQVRDKKCYDLQLKLVSALDMDNKCMKEIEKQNEYFEVLMSKVSTIHKQEYVTQHMRGIGDLIGKSFKYMGLMLLSPLAGFIPGIAIQTLATRKMIHNIYHHLHPEEIKHIRYEAVNYDSELNQHLTDIDYTDTLIEDTLKDVEKLKEDFMMIYNRNIPGYEDTLKNIQSIERKLLRNQNRVMIVKRNLKKSKKLNDDKLKLVRKLNEQQ